MSSTIRKRYPRNASGTIVKDKEESSTALGGNVTGPAAATDGSLAQFDGTTGELLKDGPVIGIANTNVPKIDDAAVIATDFAVFTATGIEGKSVASSKTALGIDALVTGPASVTADSLPLFDSTTGKLIKQGPVIGVGDGNVAKFDGAGAAVNDYTKLTAAGLVGREYSEVLSDIGAAPLAAPAITGSATFQRFASTINAIGNSGASKTVDYAALTNQTMTISEACAITIANVANGARVSLFLYSDGTAESLTWPATTPATKWIGTAPATGPATGEVFAITFFNDGTTLVASSAMAA